MPRLRHAIPIALALLLAAASAGAQDARVRGRVSLGVAGAKLGDLGPIVVYLEPIGAAEAPGGAPGPAAKIRQRSAQFTPGFMAVSVGQNVEMPNDDAIYHNVFSYSKGNQFDLGLYAAGESRTIAFRQPGVVKIYCSIHESMTGTIFVAPTRHFTRVSSSGGFSLEGVAPGRYRLVTWCERLPETSRELRLAPGQELAVEISLGADAAP
jgi:plastocyanin